MNANGQLIETLTRSEIFQNYERAYTEATGLPVTLRPVETWHYDTVVEPSQCWDRRHNASTNSRNFRPRAA